jgi:transcription elongation factor GreA
VTTPVRTKERRATPRRQDDDREWGVTETTNVTWLTQEAYDRLKGELDFLSGEGRTEIAKKIEEARLEGDLRENGGYHAAKEEQGKQEARIRQLQQLLQTAQVGEAPVTDDGTVTPGMVITVDLAGDEETFLLGSREVAGDTDLDVYSEKSPLGSAILGRKAGDKVSYTAPNGREVPVTILTAKPFTG